MKRERNEDERPRESALRGLRRLLKVGDLTPAAVLAVEDLVALPTALGHAAVEAEAAMLVRDALVRAIETSPDRDVARVLFDRSGRGGASLGGRRAAAAELAEVTADSFRVRRERRLLDDLARALLIELATASSRSERRRGAASLEIETGVGRVLSRLTAARSPVVLGRSPECDIQLRDDARVSRRHAVLELIGDRWFLRDLGSRNGTEAASGLVRSDAVPLEDGDVFTVGATRVRFRGGDEDAAATVAPGRPS